MDAGAASLLQSGIFWVLLILVGLVVGIWFIVFYWQYEILGVLKKSPPEIALIQEEVKNIHQAVHPYSPDDPEPYGSLSARVNKQVDSIANQLAAQNNQHGEIQTQLNNLGSGSLQMIVSAPFYVLSWYRLRRDTGRVWREINELKRSTQNAWTQVNDIENQAWVIALGVRAADQQKKEIQTLLDRLSDQKLYGDTFESILEKEDQTVAALESIPPYFFMAEETDISDQASKADVWEVHRILTESRPVLDEMQDKLTLWASKYQQLVDKAAHNRDQIARVEQLANVAPEGISVEEQRKQLIALGDTLRVLSDTLTRLEVESIDPVEQQLDQVQRTTSELGNLFRQGYRDYSNLKKHLVELLALHRETSDLFGYLLKNPIYPVLWDISQNRIMGLNKQINELGGLEKTRVLQDTHKDMIAAQELLVSLKAASEQIRRVGDEHTELVALFKSDEIQHGQERFEKYNQLASQIEQYSPDNWAREDSAASYRADVQKLEAMHTEILGREHTKSLSESETSRWLQKTGALVETHQQMRIRSEKLQVRFGYLQTGEKRAKEAYESLQKALAQLHWLVNSNVMLKRIAEREISRLEQQSRQCGDQLSQPMTGVIENKIQSVKSLNEAVEDAGHRWLEQLNLDIDQRCSLLVEKLGLLSKIANLDDPAIDKVQRLLAQETQKHQPGKDLPAFHLALDDVITALKGRSLIWQELVAAQNELEEIVETPLLDAFNHAEAKRKLAIDALTSAARVIPEQRRWPPCTVSMSEESSELAKLESARSALINQNTRAIWAVRQYGELAASYQTLAGKIERSREWALHEQKRIQDLEDEIERLIRKWQVQEREYSANPEAVEQIRRLRAQAKLTLERQKQSWSMPSPELPGEEGYENILHHLIEIVRMLRSFTVKIQDDSEMSVMTPPE